MCKRVQISLGLLPHSSNCVINLAPDKRAVLQEAFRVLKVMVLVSVAAKQAWGVPVVCLPLRNSKWDLARHGCRMGSGEDISAGGPKKGMIRGLQILLAPFVSLLLEASLHSLLPSSPGERCTSVTSTPASA